MTPKISNLILIQLFIMFSIFGCQKNNVNSVSITELPQIQKQKQVALLDVRTASEFAQGNIANAKNIDVLQSDFKEQIKSLDKNKPYYVYCKSGARSKKASKIMKEQGFDVINLEGGYMAYIKGKP